MASLRLLMAVEMSQFEPGRSYCAITPGPEMSLRTLMQHPSGARCLT